MNVEVPADVRQFHFEERFLVSPSVIVVTCPGFSTSEGLGYTSGRCRNAPGLQIQTSSQRGIPSDGRFCGFPQHWPEGSVRSVCRSSHLGDGDGDTVSSWIASTFPIPASSSRSWLWPRADWCDGAQCCDLLPSVSLAVDGALYPNTAVCWTPTCSTPELCWPHVS